VVKSHDAALVRSVRANCLHVLTPVTTSGDAHKRAAEQFGNEVAADLLIASFAAYRAPLATLTQRIERLQTGFGRDRNCRSRVSLRGLYSSFCCALRVRRTKRSHDQNRGYYEEHSCPPVPTIHVICRSILVHPSG